MASLCRSAAMAGVRSAAAQSKTLFSKSLAPKATTTMPSLFPPSTRTASRASRIAVVLGTVESMMPLHSVIASTRLKSIIAVDSSCWSWLSQGLAIPL